MILAVFTFEITNSKVYIFLKQDIFVQTSSSVYLSLCVKLSELCLNLKHNLFLCLSFFVQLHVSLLKQTNLILPLFLYLHFPILKNIF